MKKLRSKDFMTSKYIRACGQRAVMSKASGKDGKKNELEFNTKLHKLTV